MEVKKEGKKKGLLVIFLSVFNDYVDFIDIVTAPLYIVLSIMIAYVISPDILNIEISAPFTVGKICGIGLGLYMIFMFSIISAMMLNDIVENFLNWIRKKIKWM